MEVRNTRLVALTEQLAAEAQNASRSGTFGVAGALVTDDWRILRTVRNNVLSPSGTLLDSTAHAERQLIDWYYGELKSRILPPPAELTVVTTLDPCLMCGASLAMTGFKVISVAPDTYAGIHWNGCCSGLPDRLAKTVRQRFAFAPSGLREERADACASAGIPEDLVRRCFEVFSTSLTKVRAQVSSAAAGGDGPCKSVVTTSAGKFAASLEGPDDSREIAVLETNEGHTVASFRLDRDAEAWTTAARELCRVYSARSAVSGAPAQDLRLVVTRNEASLVRELLDIGAFGSTLEAKTRLTDVPVRFAGAQAIRPEDMPALPPFYRDNVFPMLKP